MKRRTYTLRFLHRCRSPSVGVAFTVSPPKSPKLHSVSLARGEKCKRCGWRAG